MLMIIATMLVSITSDTGKITWHKSPKNATPTFGRLSPSSKASRSCRRHRGRDVDQCHRPCCHPSPKVLRAFVSGILVSGCRGFAFGASGCEVCVGATLSKVPRNPATQGQDTQKPDISKKIHAQKALEPNPETLELAIFKIKNSARPRHLRRSGTRTRPFCSIPGPGPSRCDARQKAACPFGGAGGLGFERV